MIASAVLALGAFAALLSGLWLFGCWIGDTFGRWLDKRLANPLPRFDHSAWKGNGA